MDKKKSCYFLVNVFFFQNNKLEEALNEIEELKSTRDRAAKMVESIVRQRDMYRVLLAQTAGGDMVCSEL